MRLKMTVGKIEASLAVDGVTVMEYASEGKTMTIDAKQPKRGDEVYYITDAQLRADMRVDRNRENDPDPWEAVIVRINKKSVRIRFNNGDEMTVPRNRVIWRDGNHIEYRDGA